MSEQGDPNPLAVLSPPHWVITGDDHGAYVVIASWTMMCYMVLIVLVRLIRKFSIAAWALDDYLISAATVSSLIQSGILHRAVQSGLGRRTAQLFPNQLDAYNKNTYIYQILFIFTIVLSKLSLLQFINKLIPNATTTRGAKLLMGICGVWGVATTFGLAFQCQLPTPWNTISGVCRNQAALYYSTGIIDLVTDLVITILPLVALVKVQMEKMSKLTVMSVFVVRLSVCIAEIPRLISLTHYLQSSDPTFAMVHVSIWTQAVANLSIITACIPCLKPFLSSMRSGVFSTTLPAGFEGGLNYTLGSSRQGNSGNHSGNGSGNHSMARDLYGHKRQAVTSVVEVTIERSESRKGLTEEDRIYKTTEFATHDDDGRLARKGIAGSAL